MKQELNVRPVNWAVFYQDAPTGVTANSRPFVMTRVQDQWGPEYRGMIQFVVNRIDTTAEELKNITDSLHNMIALRK